MPRVGINIVRYNQDLSMLEVSIRAALEQSFVDCSVTLTENGSAESIKSALLAKFGDHPRFFYKENERNLGFAGAHNRFIRESDCEYILPLNPDTQMSNSYVCKLLTAFSDLRVGAAEGKMLKPIRDEAGQWILDGTGMIISRTRKVTERGHLEVDHGQYDQRTDVFGVSATAAIYRVSALESVKFGTSEYFDEDFFTYWEDLDLSWRLRLAGFSCAYVPNAVILHSRFAAQSKGGFRRPLAFIRHTRRLPVKVIRWDWRNHVFAILKNDFGRGFYRDLPWIVMRETTLLIYLLIVEPRVAGAIPDFIRLLPRMLIKRRAIQRARKVSSQEMSAWFGNS